MSNERRDRELERNILALLEARRSGATICPSEAARAVQAASDADAGDDEWRQLMEPARQAARRLVARGEVVITQGGVVVDPAEARGAIRIRKTAPTDEAT